MFVLLSICRLAPLEFGISNEDQRKPSRVIPLSVAERAICFGDY